MSVRHIDVLPGRAVLCYLLVLQGASVFTKPSTLMFRVREEKFRAEQAASRAERRSISALRYARVACCCAAITLICTLSANEHVKTGVQYVSNTGWLRPVHRPTIVAIGESRTGTEVRESAVSSASPSYNGLIQTPSTGTTTEPLTLAQYIGQNASAELFENHDTGRINPGIGTIAGLNTNLSGVISTTNFNALFDRPAALGSPSLGVTSNADYNSVLAPSAVTNTASPSVMSVADYNSALVRSAALGVNPPASAAGIDFGVTRQIEFSTVVRGAISIADVDTGIYSGAASGAISPGIIPPTSIDFGVNRQIGLSTISSGIISPTGIGITAARSTVFSTISPGVISISETVFHQSTPLDTALPGIVSPSSVDFVGDRLTGLNAVSLGVSIADGGLHQWTALSAISPQVVPTTSIDFGRAQSMTLVGPSFVIAPSASIESLVPNQPLGLGNSVLPLGNSGLLRNVGKNCIQCL
jgi:hypothetical protein